MTFPNVFLVAAISVLLVSGNASAQTKNPTTKPALRPATKPAVKSSDVVLRTSNDSLSYSIGLNIAQNMKQQGLTNINSMVLAKGLDDALKGGSMVMTPEQANGILGAFMQKQMAVRQAEGAKAAEGNKKIGSAFLDQNKTKPGIVTTASGLQYMVEKVGTGAKPATTDRVKVHYTGRLIDGKV